MLSLPLPPSRSTIEQAADIFLEFGVGEQGAGSVVIRSGGLGAYVKSRDRAGGWVEAYWTEQDEGKIVDVTGRFSILEFRWRSLTASRLSRSWEQLFGRTGGWVEMGGR